MWQIIYLVESMKHAEAITTCGNLRKIIAYLISIRIVCRAGCTLHATRSLKCSVIMRAPTCELFRMPFRMHFMRIKADIEKQYRFEMRTVRFPLASMPSPVCDGMPGKAASRIGRRGLPRCSHRAASASANVARSRTFRHGVCLCFP